MYSLIEHTGNGRAVLAADCLKQLHLLLHSGVTIGGTGGRTAPGDTDRPGWHPPGGDTRKKKSVG